MCCIPFNTMVNFENYDIIHTRINSCLQFCLKKKCLILLACSINSRKLRIIYTYSSSKVSAKNMLFFQAHFNAKQIWNWLHCYIVHYSADIMSLSLFDELNLWRPKGSSNMHANKVTGRENMPPKKSWKAAAKCDLILMTVIRLKVNAAPL